MALLILSKFPVEESVKTLHIDEEEHQARYIESVLHIGAQKILRVASVYVPNGSEINSPKFNYKLHFLDQLYLHIQKTLTYEECFIVGGDYNIAPYSQDVWDPISFKKTRSAFIPKSKKDINAFYI